MKKHTTVANYNNGNNNGNEDVNYDDNEDYVSIFDGTIFDPITTPRYCG